MKQKNGFVSASFWSILGTIFVKGTYLITIPLFSRLLSVEEYGDAGIFMTYAGILTIVLSGNLVAAVSTGVVKYHEKKKFLSAVMVLSLLMLIFWYAVLCIFHSFWEHVFQLTFLQITLLVFYSFGQFVLNYNSSRLIMEYRYKEQAAVLFLTLLADTVLSTVFITTLFSQDRFNGRIWGAAIPTAVSAFFIILIIVSAGKEIINMEYWKFAMQISFPMIFHGLAHIVLGQSDRLMIRRMVGAREAGIYGLVYNIAVMLAALVTALNQVWIPWMFRKLKENEEGEIRKQAYRYIFWFFVITVLMLTVSPEIIRVLAPPKYWEGISLMLPIVVSSFFTFLYTLYVNIEIYSGKTKGIAVGTCAAACINIILNYLLIPLMGYQVAAYTTVFSYLLLLILHFLLCRFYLNKTVYDTRSIVGSAVIVSFYSMIIFFLMDMILIRIVMFGSICAMVLIKRPKLPQLEINRMDRV